MIKINHRKGIIVMAIRKKARRSLNSIIGKVQRKEQKSDLERENEIKQQVAEQIARMRDIKSILMEIDFSASELPKEELEKKISPQQSLPDYELTRKMAVQYLEEAKVTEMDTSKIDACIRYAANAFAEGVKYGQLNKARWSMITLMYLIRYGRDDVPETDREQAAELQKKKEERANQYITMLKECKKLDNSEKRKAKLNKKYVNYVEEFDKKTKEFNDLRETDEGAYAMEELEKNANHPIDLSMAAAALDAMLDEISRKDMEILILKGELREINRQISRIHSQIDSIELVLSNEVYVEDRDLQSRVEEINAERQKNVADIVSENERMDKALQEHQTRMVQILNSPSSAKATAKNLVYLEKKEQKEREERERMEASRARRRAEKERKIEELKKRKAEEKYEKELDRTLSDLEEEIEEVYENAYLEDTLDEMETENYQYNEE